MEHTSAQGLDIRLIFQVIERKKNYLIGVVLFFLVLVLLYNFLATPVYQSSVLIKKEQIYDYRDPDPLNRIMSRQTTDEIDTEIEINKSRSVLEKVVLEKKLFLQIESIKLSKGKNINLNYSYPLYEQWLGIESPWKEQLPRFENIQLKPDEVSHDYHLKLFGDNQYLILDAEKDNVIMSGSDLNNSAFNLPNLIFTMQWSAASAGSEVYFNVQNLEIVVEQLAERISIRKIGKTKIFQLSVKSDSPFEAQLLAATVVDKFREVRLEQKQQTVKYSYDFADQQLQQIDQKLKAAEDTLSKFKSKHKITSIDDNSAEVVDFLSKLETEKVNTDLELTEYENKIQEMRREVKNRGYFDQTYLTPESNNESYSPFSVLLRQLSDLELKRLELLQKRKDTHPDVVTINEQISQIKAQLTDYNQNTIIAYQIIINSLREKQNRLLSLIQKYSGRIESLPAEESQLAELIRQKEVYAKMFSLLLDKREEMRMAELSKLQDIIVVDPAQKPLKPISPRKSLNVILALLAGVMLGLTAIFVLEHFEKRLTNLDDVERLFSVTLMGILPVYDAQLREQIRNSKSIEERAVVLIKEQYAFKEMYRLLRTKIGNIPGGKMMMFTSCEENTGKTTVISNLALSFAKMGKKVLVLDCDLRKGKIGKFFDLPENARGMIDYLSNNQNRPEVYNNFSFLTQQTLAVVPNGGYTDDSSELLSAMAVKSMLEDFQKAYDYILIDTPPITKVSDVLILGDFVKDIILIVRPFLTYKEAIRGALEEMRQAGLNLQGVVVNGFNVGKSAYYYRYGHGYNYQTISES
ncbi:MAG: hypothetical protein A2Y94_09940 [Caldithrix sp. RBG_13_44_9]|nr:MAG: hypothetical protein A2Y94_09940 [Caldithrix sp. RBG_13_44_9]